MHHVTLENVFNFLWTNLILNNLSNKTQIWFAIDKLLNLADTYSKILKKNNNHQNDPLLCLQKEKQGYGFTRYIT